MTQRASINTEKTRLMFFAKSTTKAIAGKADGLTGFVEAVWTGNDLALQPTPAMHVELAVESLKTGHPIQDTEMWKLIDSKRFPKIAADLKELRATPRHGAFEAVGMITLAGLARRYEGTIEVRRGPGEIVVDGFLEVDVRAFGLKQATLFTLAVEPIVKVHLHLIASV